jgi:hypothetical protein
LLVFLYVVCALFTGALWIRELDVTGFRLCCESHRSHRSHVSHSVPGHRAKFLVSDSSCVVDLCPVSSRYHPPSGMWGCIPMIFIRTTVALLWTAISVVQVSTAHFFLVSYSFPKRPICFPLGWRFPREYDLGYLAQIPDLESSSCVRKYHISGYSQRRALLVCSNIREHASYQVSSFIWFGRIRCSPDPQETPMCESPLKFCRNLLIFKKISSCSRLSWLPPPGCE